MGRRRNIDKMLTYHFFWLPLLSDATWPTLSLPVEDSPVEEEEDVSGILLVASLRWIVPLTLLESSSPRSLPLSFRMTCPRSTIDGGQSGYQGGGGGGYSGGGGCQ